MKTSIYFCSVLCLALLGASLTSCNEDEKAAAAVARKKMDDSLIERVGRVEVLLEQLHRELYSKKENWVKIKTMAATYERRAKEANIAVERYESEAKRFEALAEEKRPTDVRAAERLLQSSASNKRLVDAKRNEAARYESRVQIMKDREAATEEKFRQFEREYNEKKVEIRIMKDELASLKAMGSLDDQLSAESESEKRMERIQELEESIKADCDRAQAIIEIDAASF